VFDAAFTEYVFRAYQFLDPYIRKFVSPSGHSHLRYFVASRPIMNHIPV